MRRRRREASDFSAEIEAHIQLETERLREQGLSDEEARLAAHRAFGNVTHAQERFYESARCLWWDNVWRDIRYALRTLRGSPGFTINAVLTIVLVIGGASAIFSVWDAALLHPLPYPRPDNLVSIKADLHGVSAEDVGINEPEWPDLHPSGVFD